MSSLKPISEDGGVEERRVSEDPDRTDRGWTQGPDVGKEKRKRHVRVNEREHGGPVPDFLR